MFLIVILLISAHVKVVASSFEAQIVGGTGPEPCMKLCTGISNTPWSGGCYNLLMDVDISSCGFVSKPIITATLEGDFAFLIPGGNVVNPKTTRTSFEYGVPTYPLCGLGLPSSYLLDHTRTYHYKVNWQAIGYTCQICVGTNGQRSSGNTVVYLKNTSGCGICLYTTSTLDLWIEDQQGFKDQIVSVNFWFKFNFKKLIFHSSCCLNVFEI